MFAPVVPGSLVAVLGGIVAVHLFNLDEHGVAIVGDIKSGLPSFGLPDVGLSDYFDIAPAVLGAMLIGFAEGLGAAKTYAARNNYEVDPNRELLGLGAAGIGAGLFERHAGQRQPLEDCGERRRRREEPALIARGRRAHGSDAALPDRLVRRAS